MGTATVAVVDGAGGGHVQGAEVVVARALAVELAGAKVDVRSAVAVHPRLGLEAVGAGIAGVKGDGLEDGEHLVSTGRSQVKAHGLVCANHGAQCPVSPRYARPSRADPAVAREALRPPWPALETRKTSHQRATQALHQLKHGCLGCPSSRVSPIRSPFLLQVYSLLKPRPTLRPTLRRMPPDLLEDGRGRKFGV